MGVGGGGGSGQEFSKRQVRENFPTDKQKKTRGGPPTPHPTSFWPNVKKPTAWDKGGGGCLDPRLPIRT